MTSGFLPGNKALVELYRQQAIQMSQIRVTPLGAGRDVGRSCILVSMCGKNIMLDCGLHMAFNDERRLPDFSYICGPSFQSEKSEQPTPCKPPIDCVIVTHFHLDHVGALPYFTDRFNYEGPIYMTHPTKAISRVLVKDAMKLSMGIGMLRDCFVFATTVHTLSVFLVFFSFC